MKDYRYALRNFSLSDEEYANILEDVINDISIKTRFFVKDIPIDISTSKKSFDLNEVLSGYDADSNYNLMTSEQGYSQTIASKAPIEIEYVSYIHTRDLSNNIIYNAKDSLREGELFYKMINRLSSTMFEVNSTIMDDNYVYRFIIGLSFIPNIASIDTTTESKIAESVISGLLYKCSTLYSSRFDSQQIAFYEKKYKDELNKLIDFKQTYITNNLKDESWQ